MREISAARGKFRQHGRFGGLITTPVLGSSGPGQQIPAPRIMHRCPNALPVFVETDSIARTTAAIPDAAPSPLTIGVRVWPQIIPAPSTSPAAILVPPMSTPMIKLPG